MENNECLFEVKTFAGSREQAKQIVENWKKHAGTMYPSLLEILTQDFPDTSSQDEDSYESTPSVIGSPRDVYNYDVINRNPSEEDSILENNSSKETENEKNNNSNNTDVIEGNINLFDLIEKNQN